MVAHFPPTLCRGRLWYPGGALGALERKLDGRSERSVCGKADAGYTPTHATPLSEQEVDEMTHKSVESNPNHAKGKPGKGSSSEFFDVFRSDV